jgi:hypothetical protein
MSNLKNTLIHSFLALLVFSSCCKNAEKQEYIKLTSTYELADQLKDSSKNGYPFYYGDFNFILIDSNTFYFFKHDEYIDCDFGFNAYRPPRLYLYPDSLITVQRKDLHEFLRKNIIPQLEKKNSSLIALSSNFDSINKNLQSPFDELTKTYDDVHLTIRKCTEEETAVAASKLMGTKYQPETINWKYGFGDVILEPLPIEK